MKISYREPDHKINQGEREGLLSISINVLLIAAVICCAFFVLKVLLATIAPRVPFSMEKRLSGVFSSFFSRDFIKSDPETDQRLRALLQRIILESKRPLPAIDLHIVCMNIENAFTLPGAEIMVTSKLIQKLESEEELAFVLGHEAGHIANRDSMKAFGELAFQIGFAMLVYPFVGDGADTVVGTAGLLTSRSFSREQELSADRFGLDAIQKIYGDVAGALVVFEKFKEIEQREYGGKLGFFQSLALTHPYADERLEKVRQLAGKRGWNLKPVSNTSIEDIKAAVDKGCGSEKTATALPLNNS